MKIGILQTDSVRPELIAQFGDYPDMFQSLFRQVDPTLRFETYDVQHGNYPNTIHACDAYLTTGSKASVYDDENWIKILLDYFVELNSQNKKLLAVCFGHQLVADAFGGKTEKSTNGWGVGVHSVQVRTKPSWMQPALDAFNVVVSHQDQVTQLPGYARLIAGNNFCPYGMFQLGENILTIQGHPEFSKPYAEAMMQYRADIIGERTFREGIKSLQKPVDDLTIAKWFINFLKTK
ncbi:glutamine amidotransferase-related protein [Kaarinaea lacus]